MPGSIKIDDGSGNYTILTNAGSLGSDKTITIPNETATLATTNGITSTDLWHLTTNYTGDAQPITSNLARYTNDGVGYIGTGMTESSGVFTFPSTVIWRIVFTAVRFAQDSYDIRRLGADISTTTNNSTYGVAARSQGTIVDNAQTGDSFYTNYTYFDFDVTDTSTHKVRFETFSTNTSRDNVLGTSDRIETAMSFTRLGDT